MSGREFAREFLAGEARNHWKAVVAIIGGMIAVN
jgi:hypothetical protein